MKTSTKILIALGVIVVIVLGFIGWANGVYNGAVRMQERTNVAFGNVQAAYQRRADLVPNLVATVKGAADNEKTILLGVTEARSGISSAKTAEELDRAGQKINAAINLTFEAYPQIRSTQNFQDLQVQLEGTEDRINVARTNYNTTIGDYNSLVRGVFRKMALNIMGDDNEFPRLEPFKAAAGSEKAPDVKF